MKPATKIIFLNEENEKFFGEGPARLMHEIERTGSLRAASISMEMAYTKALKLIKNAEASLGFPLITRVTGGKDGGGSCLTAEGKSWLVRYENYRDACIRANAQLYEEFFPEQNQKREHQNSTESDSIPLNPYENTGCVIMASGLGKRFGGNKLMADFHGEPLITRILDVTENLFIKRVVVTRHEEVAKLCQDRGIPAILHDLPYRSDTIRLGLEAMPDIDRCIFCPGDQPLLRRETIEFLLQASDREPDFIWRTTCDGTPGSPVLFPSWAFGELKHLPEGKGGVFLIKKYPERLRLLNVTDMYELKDIDSPSDLIELLKVAAK